MQWRKFDIELLKSKLSNLLWQRLDKKEARINYKDLYCFTINCSWLRCLGVIRK